MELAKIARPAHYLSGLVSIGVIVGDGYVALIIGRPPQWIRPPAF